MGILSWLFKKDEEPVAPQQNLNVANTIRSVISNVPGLGALSSPLVKDTANEYIQNRYVEPIKNLPNNLYETVRTDKPFLTPERGSAALGTLAGIATLIPDPVQDIAIPAYDAVKGFAASAKRGEPLPQQLESARKSFTLEKPVGLGEALTTNKPLQDIGNIAELPAMLAVGALSPKGATRDIKSAQELASIIATNMKKGAGESISLPLSSVLKSFNLTDDVLDALDKGAISGSKFSIQKIGNKLEFIFDEGYKPSKGLKVAPKKQPKVKIENPVVQEVAPKVEPKLLTGGTEPLTPKEAVRIYKKTGEAQPFVNKLPDGTEPIQLEQRLLPGGTEPLTTKDAVRIGKKTGKAVPFVNELPAGTKPIRLLDNIEDTRNIKAPTAKQDRVLGSMYFDLQKIKKDIGDIPRVVASFLDPSRLMENAGITKGSETVKQFLRTHVVEPLWKANNDYANDIRTWGNRMQSDIVDKFKLTNDDFESVLKYGENEDKVKALQDLQLSNPDNWQSIVEADKSFRQIFDELFTIWSKKRAELGLDPVPYIENYYRRVREGGLFVPGNMVNQVLDSTGGMDYKFFGAERSRTRSTNYSKNAMQALQNYVQGVLAQIHYTPIIQKEHQLANVLVDSSPELARWFKKHADIMAGSYKNFFTQLIGGLGDTGQSVIKTAIKNVGKNLVTSATVALSNLGANVYTIVEVGEKNFAQAIKKVLFGSDFMSDYTTGGVQSQFLNTRYIDDINFYKSTPDKIYSILSYPAQLFDKFTAEVAVTAKKDQLLSQGVPLDEAIRQADDWASRMMANRAQGMLPTAMQEYNPLSMFATEPINQIHYLFEIAKAKGNTNAMTGALYMTKLFTYVYLFNSLYQEVTGRRLMVDPINLITSVAGEALSADDTDSKIKKIARAVLDEIPIIGRSTIPVTSAVQTADDIKDDPIKALARIGMLFNPMGGLSQFAKSEEGIKNYVQGYDEVKAGNRIKYPISQDLLNLGRAIISGTHSFPEARQYFDKGYTALGDNDSMIIKSLQSIGEEEARRRGIPFDVGNDAAIRYYQGIRNKQEAQQFKSRVEALKTEAKYVFADPASTPQQIEEANRKFVEGVQEIAQDVRLYAAQKNGNLIDQAKAVIGIAPTLQTPQIQTPDAPRIDRTVPQATTTADQATLGAYQSMPKPTGRASSSIKVGSIKKLPKLKLPSTSTGSKTSATSKAYQGMKIQPLSIPRQPRLRVGS